MTHVLFLDFDGVLHPQEAAVLDGNLQIIPNPALFQWIPLLHEILEPYPELQIIVSSDWRRLCSDAQLVRILGPLGARFAGVMETWGSSRANELLIEARRRRLTTWLALDDHLSVHAYRNQEPRFVVCDSSIGIASKTVQIELEQKLKAMSTA